MATRRTNRIRSGGFRKGKKYDMYLFFVREFNDIDHITPIVWKMQRDNFPVAVYNYYQFV